MPNFQAGSVEATLELDRAPFTQSLSIARAMADAFERGEFMATLGANLGELRDDLRSGTRDLTEFARQRATATVRADDRPARRTLTGFDQVMRRYSRSWGQQGIRARVQADVRRAQGQLRLLERQVEGITDERHRITVEAEITRTRERLEGLGRLATSLGLRSPTISVGLRGQAATYAQMLGLQRLADRLDGYDIRFGADIDGSLSRALPNLLGALELQIAKYKTVMTGIAAITMPMFYSSLAALPAVLTTAAGAVGSLAISLGKGLVGAVGGATMALGLGGAALLAYGIAAVRTWQYVGDFTNTLYQQYRAVDQARKVTEELKLSLKALGPGMVTAEQKARALAMAEENVAQEQEKMVTMMQIMSPRLERLNNEVFDVEMGMLRFSGAIMNQVAPALSYLIGTGKEFGPAFSKGAQEMVGGMSDVAIAFIGAAAEGQNLRSITTILKGVSAAGEDALTVVGSMVLTTVNVMAKMVPAGLSILGVLKDVTQAAYTWSESAKGQRRIGEVWRDLWRRGRDLWDIGVDLGVALWGVGAALEAAGTGDKLLRQLGGLVKGFRQTMRAGGAGREAITDFMNTAEPLLDAGISLASEFGKQFGRLAKAVIGFKEEGSKLTVLEDIFYAIEDSLKPMADFFLYEFKNIGPLIGPFVRELAKWFSVMGKSQPEMKFFIGFLTDMLRLFNSLPDDTQRNIARVLAYVYAIKALGGNQAAGGLVGLAFSVRQWLLLRRIWKNMPKAPVIAPPVSGPAASPKPGAPGAPVPIPTTPATGPAAKGLWRSRLLGLAKGVGVVGITVGIALAIRKVTGIPGFVDILKDYVAEGKAYLSGEKTFKQAVYDFYEKTLTQFENVPLVGRLVKKIRETQQKTLDETRNLNWKQHFAYVGFQFIKTIRDMPIIGPMLRKLEGVFRATKEKQKGQGWRGIGGGAVVAMAKGFARGGLVARAVALVGAWFGKTSGSSKGKRWSGIGGSAIGAMAKGFRSGGLIGAAVALVGNWFGKTQGSSKGKRWGGIGSGAIGAMAKGFARGGLVGAAVALVGHWFGRTQGSSKGRRWGGIGSGAVSAIVKGWKSGGLIGAAVSLIASWFGKSQGEKNKKRWSPLGSSAAGAIVKGWKSGGLVGAAVALVNSWFGKTSGSSKGKRWSPIGQGAAGAIVKGWKDGGLLGAATALVNSWFGKSQSGSKGKPWKGIGGGAVSAVISGWRNGDLLGAGTALVGSWFGKTDATSRSKNWRGIGGGAVGAMVSGWKSGGLVGAVVSVVGQAASGANNKQGSFRTAGNNAGSGFVSGWNAVGVASAFINKISGGLAALARWLRQRSPSQRLADFAWNTAQGFVKGLDSNKNIERGFRRIGERGVAALKAARNKLMGAGLFTDMDLSPNLRPVLTPIRSTTPVPRGPVRRPSPGGARRAPRPGVPGRTPPPVNVSVTVPVSRDMDVAEERAVAAAQQQIRAAFAEIKRQGSSNSAYIAGEVS